MRVITYAAEPQLKIRVDEGDNQAAIHYLYGNFERWRKTPYTTADYHRDAAGVIEQVYDFFDMQWRGC